MKTNNKRFWWGFIKPTYVHYSKKWNINWFSLSFNRRIMITPNQIRMTYIICLLGYGCVLEYRTKYTLPKVSINKGDKK